MMTAANHAVMLLAAMLSGVVDHLTTVRIGNRNIEVRGIVEDDVRSCTVAIDGQQVPTYGHGDLEAYRCGGLLAAGRLQPRDGAERIGLVYLVGGSPGVDFRTAIALERVDGRWRIEPASLAIHDDAPEARSIGSLRRWERAREPARQRYTTRKRRAERD